MRDFYVNRGSDPRMLGAWAGWVQSKLSFRAPMEPLSVLVAFPPYLSLAIPYPVTQDGRWVWRYATVRVGWRYDTNWKGYIADVIVKLRMTRVVHY